MWKAIVALLLAWPGLALAELVPDPRFGTAGAADVPFPGMIHLDYPRIALLPDRRIAVTALMRSGTVGAPPTLRFARLLPDGQPDPAFGGGAPTGVVLTPGAVDYAWILDAHLAPDGSQTIVASTATPQVRTTLVHVTADGRADPAFNGGQPLHVADGDFSRLRLVVRDDGYLVIGIEPPPCCVNVQSGFRAWRFRHGGTPEAAFGNAGSLVVAPAGTIVRDAMPVPGGGFQVLQRSTVNGVPRNAWRRYRADGQLDTAFGDGGEEELEIVDDAGIFDVEPLGDGTFAGMAAGSCLRRTIDAQGRLLQYFNVGCVTAGTRPRVQRYGSGFLVKAEQRFGGVPPPDDGTYLWVIGPDGRLDGEFAEPQGDRWRITEQMVQASFDVVGDGGRAIVLASQAGANVRVLRYLDLRGAGSIQPVPALGLPALLVVGAALLMLAARCRKRFNPA